MLAQVLLVIMITPPTARSEESPSPCSVHCTVIMANRCDDRPRYQMPSYEIVTFLSHILLKGALRNQVESELATAKKKIQVIQKSMESGAFLVTIHAYGGSLTMFQSLAAPHLREVWIQMGAEDVNSPDSRCSRQSSGRKNSQKEVQ